MGNMYWLYAQALKVSRYLWCIYFETEYSSLLVKNVLRGGGGERGGYSEVVIHRCRTMKNCVYSLQLITSVCFISFTIKTFNIFKNMLFRTLYVCYWDLIRSFCFYEILIFILRMNKDFIHSFIHSHWMHGYRNRNRWQKLLLPFS